MRLVVCEYMKSVLVNKCIRNFLRFVNEFVTRIAKVEVPRQKFRPHMVKNILPGEECPGRI